MDRLIKLPSRQAGPFTAQQNLIDFDLPDTDVYDLSKSFINVMCSVTTEFSSDNVINVHPTYASNVNPFHNVTLVRDATMSARRAGKIEDLREIGVLRNTLKNYTSNKNMDESSMYGSLYSQQSIAGNRYSPARRIYKLGDQLSENLEFPIQFKLSDIYETGSLREWHTPKWGQTRLHLELRLGQLGFVHDKYDDVAGTFETTDGNTVISDNVFANDPEKIQGHTNLRVSVVRAAGTVIRVITKIEVIDSGVNKGKLKYTFNSTITGAVGDAATIKDNVNYGTVSVSYPSAEIVLHALGKPGPAPDRLQYLTYTTEEFATATQIVNFQRMFELEPNCMNFMCLTPVDNNRIGNNSEAKIDSYRFSLNNKDLTDRDITLFTPLYHDRLSMTLLNSQYDIESINDGSPANSHRANTKYTTLEDRTTILGNPVPLTQQPKLLQINIDCDGTAGVDTLNIYKQVVKSI